MTTMTTSTVQQTMTSADVATAAQRQYFSRPADQKFSTLDELYASVQARRMHALELESDVIDLRAYQSDDRGVVFNVKGEQMAPTHWAFGQTCSMIGAPAAYLRKVAAQGSEDLVVNLLNHGIAKRESAGFKFLAVDDPDSGDSTLYAATSPAYGRIWDADVVESVKTVIDAQDGKFYSPWAWGHAHRALFASHHDVFMYFIDGGSIVDGGGERDQLHRGIYVWNSEVGASTFGIATFLFRETCGNFLVWGVENVKILNIRHTSGGPAKFVNEAIPALREFGSSSVAQLEAGVQAAKSFILPADDDDIIKFAGKNGFNRAEAKRAINQARLEEGQCTTLWNLVNGFTASARLMAFADAKADLELRAGKLMKVVSA